MQLKRVIVGVDFSEASLAAARWTARHFAPEAEFVLVHAIEIPEPPGFLRQILPPDGELARTAKAGGDRRLREFGQSLGVDRVWIEVREGRPADLIPAVAIEMDADLIVVGEHGKRGGLRDAMGSTAENLVRTSPVPVLLARGLPEGSPRSILMPVDESEILNLALGWGRLLAERFHATPRAIYAVHPKLLGRLRLISTELKERALEEKLLDDARAWLVKRLEACGFDAEDARTSVTVGDPGQEIVAAARRFDVDLIVMASRGAGGVGRALMGSVARTVLRGAPCPVLVINQRED